jgi:hypothetical protein
LYFETVLKVRSYCKNRTIFSKGPNLSQFTISEANKGWELLTFNRYLSTRNLACQQKFKPLNKTSGILTPFAPVSNSHCLLLKEYFKANRDTLVIMLVRLVDDNAL